MRLTVTMTATEWQGLQELSAEAMRTPKGQLRWLLRQALLNCRLIEGTTPDQEDQDLLQRSSFEVGT